MFLERNANARIKDIKIEKHPWIPHFTYKLLAT